MKNLTKGIFIVLIALFGYQMNAQSFGIKGGLNMATMSLSGGDDDVNVSDYTKSLMGFHLGLTAEFPLNDMLAFETGLFYSTKGVSIEIKEENVNFTTDMNLNYLDIPLAFKAYFDLGGMKAYGLLGPYIGYGLSGTVSATFSVGGNEQTQEDDIKWGSEADDHFRKLDYGLTFGGGLDINNITLGVAYDMGMANIAAVQENDNEAKNRVLKISVGYKF